MEIRFAAPVDIPGIIDLLKQVGQVHHAGRPDIFRAGAQKYGPSQVLSMLNKPDTVIFVAVEGEKVLGYGFCFIKNHALDPVMTDRIELHINDLCVDEKCRGKGIGKALYEAICKYAKMRKCYHVTLNVWTCNEGAMKFYESLGLKPQKIGLETILKD